MPEGPDRPPPSSNRAPCRPVLTRACGAQKAGQYSTLTRVGGPQTPPLAPSITLKKTEISRVCRAGIGWKRAVRGGGVPFDAAAGERCAGRIRGQEEADATGPVSGGNGSGGAPCLRRGRLWRGGWSGCDHSIPRANAAGRRLVWSACCGSISCSNGTGWPTRRGRRRWEPALGLDPRDSQAWHGDSVLKVRR